jgi:hypothetical protein
MPIIEYPYGHLLLELRNISDLGKVCLHFPAKLGNRSSGLFGKSVVLKNKY